LSLLERQRIAVLRARGCGVREIAALLGRSPSTISRELGRNSLAHDQGVYDGDLAHSRARERMRRPRSGRLLRDDGLRAQVQAKLELEWSPEQIAAWLRLEFPDRPSWHVCHETIYQALYRGGSGVRRQLTRRLRTGRPLCKRRRRAEHRRPRFVAPSSLIDLRPAVVGLRIRIGDWEGDLIVGRSNRSAVATIVDRTSRFLRLVHLPAGGHGADAVCAAILAAFATMPADMRRSLTWDQGAEMASHPQIAALFSDGIFFAHPGSPLSTVRTKWLWHEFVDHLLSISDHDVCLLWILSRCCSRTLLVSVFETYPRGRRRFGFTVKRSPARPPVRHAGLRRGGSTAAMSGWSPTARPAVEK
jgi:IS30 family transposase